MVGGYAATLHGARRPTIDIDVVPRWDEANLRRLCAVLRSVAAVSTTGPRVEGEQVTVEVLVEREVMTWQTTLGRIDTLVGIPDSEGMPVDFHALLARARSMPIDDLDVVVVVASLDDVITSKQYARRRKDREALPELRRIQQGAAPTDPDPDPT